MVKISYTIAEAVAVSSFSRSRLYEHIRAGRLKSFKDGGRRHIPAASLLGLMDELQEQQSGRAA